MSEASLGSARSAATPPSGQHRMPPRPRIVLPPGNVSPHSPLQHYNHNPLYINPNMSNMPPLTPVNPYENPFNMYPTKASEFLFNQFWGFKDFTMNTAQSGLNIGEKSAFWMYNKISAWSKKWFTHIFLFLVIFAYSVAGALIFVAVEGPHEQKELTDIRIQEEIFTRELWELSKKNFSYSPNPKDMWLGEAVKNIIAFKAQLYRSYQAGVMDDKEGKEERDWTFWNAVFYCGTIYTTIGYGHITPSTTTGRAITIIYAVFGIPMFLILLADFGKLFTRCIKFVWAFVRRLYYTGSCRKVRKTETVQDVMKGVQMVYEIATFRRPSQIDMTDIEVQKPPTLGSPPLAVSESSTQSRGTHLNVTRPDVPGIVGETPNTPAPSNFAVDDEFNLPVSVAIFILILYLLGGAVIYWAWEKWTFFESFYFVFISMSTIGFGDFVPQHPMYMMASILYLVFGLALTSMCINVVQVKLSDTFRQASAKIGATIGLRVADDDGSITHAPSIEIAEVHTAAIQDKTKTHKKDAAK